MDRKSAAGLMALIFLAGCGKHYVYQNTSWGMPEKAFKAARPAAAAAGERLWTEPAVINELKATVTYRLGPRGLESVRVVFDPVQVDKAQYIDYFLQIKALLAEKYGAPEMEASDLAVMSQKYVSTRPQDYQTKNVFRAPEALVELTCGGGCDGAAADGSIAISYGPVRSRTDGL